METDIKNAIKTLSAKINNTITPDEALKFTQAALNLAHTLATLDLVKKSQ